MRVRLVARAGARARGADEHVVLLLLAVRPGVLLLVDPGTVVLDGLAVDANVRARVFFGLRATEMKARHLSRVTLSTDAVSYNAL